MKKLVFGALGAGVLGAMLAVSASYSVARAQDTTDLAIAPNDYAAQVIDCSAGVEKIALSCKSQLRQPLADCLNDADTPAEVARCDAAALAGLRSARQRALPATWGATSTRRRLNSNRLAVCFLDQSYGERTHPTA